MIPHNGWAVALADPENLRLTPAQLAAKFGVTVRAVRTALSRHGVNLPRARVAKKPANPRMMSEKARAAMRAAGMKARASHLEEERERLARQRAKIARWNREAQQWAAQMGVQL